MKVQYIFGAIFIFASVYFLFNVSHKTQITKDQIISINRKILLNKNNIHILKAEWSYLTNPERIKKLADQHLSSGLQVAEQVKKQETQWVFNNIKSERKMN